MTRRDVTSSEQLKTNTVSLFLLFFLLLFLAVTEIAAVRLELVQPSVSPTCAAALTDRERWRLRYGEAGWGKRRGDNEKDFRFLCDAFSPWGQGATVIQSYRAAVQKPPPINIHCVDCYMLLWILCRAENINIMKVCRMSDHFSIVKSI